MRTLYTVPTANGQRASIALEECGLDYDTRTVNLFDGEHRSDEMLRINPFGRMPVLQIDTEGSSARNIYGSFAIGMYAAETSGHLIPDDVAATDFHHWIGIIMTDLVPAFAGQFYFSVLAPEPHEWGTNWYADIIERFLKGIDAHLANSRYFLGSDYTLVDVLMFPTAATSVVRMPGGLGSYESIARWADRVGSRGAVARGMQVSS